ncbi:MAG: hypothetical protein QM737_01450 [Ferruginibacter sp.]
MTNFETNEQAIQEAYRKGLITDKDYNAWIGAKDYKKELKKSCDAFCITEGEMKSEIEKANGLYWYKNQSEYTLQFQLMGNFQPINLQEKRMIKAQQSQPLQTQMPQRIKVDTGLAKISELADKVLSESKELKSFATKRGIVMK